MRSAQRLLLAASCLLCFGLLKRMWDGAAPRSQQTAGWARHHTGVSKSPAQNATGDRSAERSRPRACPDAADIHDIVIILKTGSTEIYDKLPHHFATTFACGVDYLIYSDLRQQFGHVEIRDALAMVSEELREEHEDLAQYRTLQQHVLNGGDPGELRGEKSWQLDKWKFLPMVGDAYQTFGDQKKWYVFIEADTYLSLHNLLLWLRQVDHRRPIYAGAQVMIGDTEFAHGGSGFLLSSAAAKGLGAAYRKEQRRWEHRLAGECCGDKVMAEVMVEASPPVRLLRAFPLIQGETLASLDWSPTHWCMPAVTWHHVDAAGLDKLWQFESAWQVRHGTEKPILFADYYTALVRPRIVSANGTLRQWDNLSKDWVFDCRGVLNPACESAIACEAFCRDSPACLQWAWTTNVCRGSTVVKLGWALHNRPALGSAEDRVAKADAEAGQGSVSGRLVDRIDAFTSGIGACEQKMHWVTENDA